MFFLQGTTGCAGSLHREIVSDACYAKTMQTSGPDSGFLFHSLPSDLKGYESIHEGAEVSIAAHSGFWVSSMTIPGNVTLAYGS